MNFFDYAYHHVGCVVRMVRGDAAALADMDISADGFWRSFEAIPAAVPALIFAWAVQARQIKAGGSLDSMGSMIARMAVLEMAFWIAPLIVLVFVLRMLGMARRIPHLIISRNWLATMTSYMFVIVPLIELTVGGQPGGATVILRLAIMAAVLWFSVRVTRIALDVTPMVAVTFVVVEFVLTYALALFALGLVGLSPQG